jgi:SEC-C motif-containing protein
MEKCPCSSGKLYSECCEPAISGKTPAPTAEALMRSRYTAYAKGEIDYIIASTHVEQRADNDPKAIKEWSESADWQKLEITRTEAGGPKDQEGLVEFTAYFAENGINKTHHEIAQFKKDKDQWFFYDSRIIPHQPYIRKDAKVKPNDPCSCGSGKKYKKCCGK